MATSSHPALPNKSQIAAWASELGFQAVGFSDVDLSEHAPHVRAFVRNGLHGDMGYLGRNMEKRLDPAQLEPETVCVITARMNYLPPDTEPLQTLGDPEQGYIARYALGRDYHKVLRRRLARLAERIDRALPGYRYRAFTDSAPVLEKALAVKSGLGWMGKHTLVLNKEAGSFFFLGEIYTSAPFEPDREEQPDACGKCSACITVCPTQAITADKKLDARRCIAYLTIEHEGVIPEPLREPMGNRVFGCDDCQLFCPWNRDAPTTDEPDFAPRHDLDAAKLIDLFEVTETGFDALTRGSAIRRIGYEQWQRNLAIGLGNGPPSEEAIAALQRRLPDASEMVAEHIRWALNRLRDGRSASDST